MYRVHDVIHKEETTDFKHEQDVHSFKNCQAFRCHGHVQPVGGVLTQQNVPPYHSSHFTLLSCSLAI